MRQGSIGTVDGHDSLILVGNPNVGKSMLFNRLTGSYVAVSNYPGTTVDLSKGNGHFDGRLWTVLDTPGTRSLFPESEEERVTLDVLLTTRFSCVVQVADAKNLRRGLLLTLQLTEMGFPLILALNMSDEARERGIHLDARKLAELLDITILQTTAITGEGVGGLRKAVPEARASHYCVRYEDRLEEAISQMEDLFPPETPGRRGLAVIALGAGEGFWEHLETVTGCGGIREEIGRIVARAGEYYARPIRSVLFEEKERQARALAEQVMSREKAPEVPALERFSRMTMRPLSGVPILLGVLFLVFLFVGQFGAGTLVDFVENTIFGSPTEMGEGISFSLFGHKLLKVPWAGLNWYFRWLVAQVFSWTLVRDMLVGPYGLISMGLTYAIAIVLPVMTTFILTFGFLEDSGYLPRLTILADRVFRMIGLTGKAVLPVLLGFGCGTMACLTTRILESRKERILATLLITLGVPCSAQLGVVMGMATRVSWWALVTVMLIVAAQVFIVGRAASHVIPGKRSAFLLEIPPLRLPRFGNIWVKTVSRVRWFLVEAVPLFLLGTLLLFVLDRTGALLVLERLARPLISDFLGLPIQSTAAFLLGFLRRDYGAAGLFDLANKGLMNPHQVIVSLVTITLFVPCVANFFIILKEYGTKIALLISGFVMVYAFLVGGVTHRVLGLFF
ncbi:MAG: ferrous iron transport protein B [Armatimonadetes bacterium]|nr:ferrous iron transport protein B [Armatimonadota bacterium]